MDTARAIKIWNQFNKKTDPFCLVCLRCGPNDDALETFQLIHGDSTDLWISYAHKFVLGLLNQVLCLCYASIDLRFLQHLRHLVKALLKCVFKPRSRFLKEVLAYLRPSGTQVRTNLPLGTSRLDPTASPCFCYPFGFWTANCWFHCRQHGHCPSCLFSL